ncbi:hypothetical protein [Haloarchaeobius sp. DFWS5]|uniref:hypothetical protein n=1 Tax=Haloarchaeobius sp. DFWS5 TaxID=3446114 RepID=UPI003EC14590
MTSFELSKREKALVVGVGAVALVAGMWIGLWLVPDAALDVPKETVEQGGQTFVDARYQPVPSAMPLYSFAVLFLGGFVIQLIYSDDELGEDALVTDGGDDRGDE